MKHGFVKVAAASPELKVADVKFNTLKIEEEIAKQAKEGTEILVFPELCLCGYTCGDLFLQPLLTDACKAALREITVFTKGISMLIFVGLPVTVEGKLYNCAAAICDGEVLGLVPKTHIPNYSEFYEKRYFSPANQSGVSVCLWGEKHTIFGVNQIFTDKNVPEVRVACEICEDLWVGNPPSNDYAKLGATIIVNLSASDETIGKADYRRMLVRSQSGRNVFAYVYADAGAGESTTDMVFAGHNMIAENGSLLAESAPFSGRTAVAEVDVSFLVAERGKINTFVSEVSADTSLPGQKSRWENQTKAFVGDGALSLRRVPRTPFVPEESAELGERAELILSIQAQALAKRLKHTNARTAVIGISGGLDSSLALLVTARAFDLCGKDRKDILAVTMPGFGTTGRTYDNALRLIACTGASGRSVDITGSVLKHFEDIGHDKDALDVTYENAQARMRTLVLMDLANKTGGLVVGTGDLSELALGWCTYNGDHISMYAVNSSVPKTLVKHLVRYEGGRTGGETERVLKEILGTEISPELLPPDKEGGIAQKTEELIGPYELHDFYLYHAIRCGAPPKKVYYLAEYAFKGDYDKGTLLKWLKSFYRRFFSQQFKRSCIPDGVKIGSVTLSPRADWRMPSDACAALWLAELEELD